MKEAVVSKEEIAAVVRTISYFDVFNFPLNKTEILKYSTIPLSIEQLEKVMNFLLSENKIQKVEDYFIPYFSDKINIANRHLHEARAKEAQRKVNYYSRLISKFPFVESVCISGSFSKGVLAEDGDVDYFIITKPGRLWVARTLLILFKKIVLLNSRKYFCVNYFIDSDHLTIPDKNLFAATEIITLKPMYGMDLYSKFMNANTWVFEIFPNSFSFDQTLSKKTDRSSPWRLVERFLNGKFGDKIDNFCFRYTLKVWKKKFSHFNENDFDLNMRTRKTVSKHHPQGFQKKVLDGMEERYHKFKL